MKPWLTVDEALRVGYGDNPLLAPLGPRLDSGGLADKMWQEPLADIPWQQVRPEERVDLLGLVKEHFVPTPDILCVASAFQGLLREHYMRRNPRIQEVRVRAGVLAAQKGEVLDSVPWFNGNAGGMAVTGITGIGKSVTVDRLLSLYPQTWEHGPRPDAGWTKFRQLVWLRVQMSSDSSRAGFLMQILSAVDAALDTDYTAQYGNNRNWTVEKLMVVVGIVLTTHCCGALVIEELQERNFSEGTSRESILLFFLRLLNFGIPIVLVGNPLGFQAFDDFSQDVRRLYSAGCFDLWPADKFDGAGWSEFFLPGLAQFNLVGRPFEWTPDLQALALTNTGGVTGFMATYWASVQRNALAAKRDHILPEDFQPAGQVPELRKQLGLIDALASRDAKRLSGIRDVPYAAFAARWIEQQRRHDEDQRKSEEHAANERSEQVAPSGPIAPRFKRVESQAKASRARAKKQQQAVPPAFAADDLRGATHQTLRAGLHALRSEHEAEGLANTAPPVDALAESA